MDDALNKIEISVNSATCYKNNNLIFEDINIELKNGDFMLIIGPNGCGKTTLIKSLCGIQKLEFGNILINNLDIHSKNSEYIENIIYLGHKNSLNNDLSVQENLEYLSVFDSSVGSNNFDKIKNAMDYFNIYKYKDYMISDLSEGNRKRTSLARLVLSKKKIWLLDEPLSFLDNNILDSFVSLIKRHQANDGIIIVSTHYDYSKSISNVKYLKMETK